MDCKEFTWILFCIIWIACCFIPSSEAYDDNLFSDSLIIINKNNYTIQSRQAAFGPRLGEEGVNGVIIPIEDIVDDKQNKDGKYGCEPIKKEKLEGIEKNFIALVERGGNCSFSDKVRNMQKSGAKAVIVGNNHGDYHLVTMYASGDTSDIKIPSVFILQYDLISLRKENSHENVTIVETDSEWSTPDIFMLTTLLPLLFIFGIFIVYKFRIDSMEADLQAESSASLGAATQEEVDALPIKIFNMKKMKENDPETCAVCIDDFKDGDKLRVLPCRHEYHVECIDLWLTTRKKFCPICKRNISGDDDDADENTPLLARNNSSDNVNNNYNTDVNQESDTEDSHVIDIPLEVENEGDYEEENRNDQESNDHVQEESNNTNTSNNNNNGLTPQEIDLIQSEDESDDPGENEPLISLVTRS